MRIEVGLHGFALFLATDAEHPMPISTGTPQQLEEVCGLQPRWRRAYDASDASTVVTHVVLAGRSTVLRGYTGCEASPTSTIPRDRRSQEDAAAAAMIGIALYGARRTSRGS